MAERQLPVNGMNCQHCKKAVSEALTDLAGVSDAHVDPTSGHVEQNRFRADERSCGRSRIRTSSANKPYRQRPEWIHLLDFIFLPFYKNIPIDQQPFL
ncbi:MAG: cation transporter [Sporolactobacillus sp.]|jgi:copper chaperone CopZ|nr:cation transporter [Sporolactobacillus sp.]